MELTRLRSRNNNSLIYICIICRPRFPRDSNVLEQVDTNARVIAIREEMQQQNERITQQLQQIILERDTANNE